MFKTDYSKLGNNDFSAMPAGEYELVIVNSQEKATKNGKEALSLRLAVRNDLTKVPTLANTNGKYANRNIFVDEWKRNIEGVYKYSQDNIMYILAAVGIPEGTPINSMNELHDMLYHKPVRAYVKKEFDEYQNDEINTIAPWNFKPTEYPQCNHSFKENNDKSKGQADPFEFEKAENPIDISMEELPF